MIPLMRSVGTANANGLCGPDHAVEQGNDNSGFALLTWSGVSAEQRADQVVVAANGHFDEVAPTVANGLPPSHSTPLGNQLNVAVPRCPGSRILCALHRGGARRNDQVRWWTVLPDGCLVDSIAVAGTVCVHGGDDAFCPPEQAWHLGAIVHVSFGENVGGDLASVGVHGKAKLVPLPLDGAMLPAIPFALSDMLGTVH